MRFSHSSLFGLTSIIATSFFCGVNSAPRAYDTVSLHHNFVSLTGDVNQFTKTALTGRDMNNNISQNELHKRDKKYKHNKKKTSKSKAKKPKAKKSKKKKSNHHTSKPSTKKNTKTKTKTKKGTSSGSGSGNYKFSGDGTYYNTGLGSCGITSKDTDLIAALNAPQMSNGANPNKNPICGKKANVKGPKGTVQVTIVDTCPPCKSGDLDLSPAAFGKIGKFEDGRINIEWSWA